MKKVFIVIFVGSLFLCCFDKKSSDNSKHLINLEKETSVSISDLFESIDVVQLETNEQCLIHRIENVIFYDNRYYILDVRLQTLFCFDASGKFLFKIDQRGQGPEEYLHIENFNIDPYTQALLLIEPWGNLFTFDLDGKFISKTKLPEEILAYNEVFPLNKDTLIFISLNKYSLVSYSKQTNSIIDKQYDDDKSCVFIPLRRAYTYNNQVFFSPPPTNDIINLSNGTVFTWNFGRQNNTSKQIEKVRDIVKSGEDCLGMGKPLEEHRNFVTEKLLNYHIMDNYETSRYRICTMDYGNFKPRYVFFDKKTNQAYVFKITAEGVQFIWFYFTGESIIVREQPDGYKFYDESFLSEKQKEIVNAHKEEDNPLLFKYNLKQ